MRGIRQRGTELKRRPEGNGASYGPGDQRLSFGTVHGRERSMDIARGRKACLVTAAQNWMPMTNKTDASLWRNSD